MDRKIATLRLAGRPATWSAERAEQVARWLERQADGVRRDRARFASTYCASFFASTPGVAASNAERGGAT